MSITANPLTAPTLSASAETAPAQKAPIPATPGPAIPAPSGSPELAVIEAHLHDVRVQPLLEELAVEYSARYGDFFSPAGAQEELSRYPASEFEPPHGALLILQEAGETVAGGAFRRYDQETAEFKRIWTHSAHRRKGLARRVLVELERLALGRGYTRVYLTTGPRQPEAKALYLATGYTPLFDLDADPEEIKHLAFTKPLAAD